MMKINYTELSQYVGKLVFSPFYNFQDFLDAGILYSCRSYPYWGLEVWS